MLLFCLLAFCSWGHAQNIIPGKNFDRVFIMLFENTGFDTAMADPNFNAFAAGGMLLTDYYTTYHPSQPNYIDLICGSNMGCKSDDDIDVKGDSVVDLLENSFLSWKAYQESYPGNCYTGSHTSTYYRKHNPFISMVNVTSNATRCAKIVNANDSVLGLDADLNQGTLPQYSFYTPDINNDGHDTGVSYAGDYLASFFSNRVFPNGTLIFITFDEDDHDENNHLYSVMQGSMIQAGTTQSTYYTHNSFLKTVEENWGLPSLGRDDVDANGFVFVPDGTQ
jgi:phospholipase C